MCKSLKICVGGQSGTGDQQTYLVWTASGTDLDQIASTLQEWYARSVVGLT